MIRRLPATTAAMVTIVVAAAALTPLVTATEEPSTEVMRFSEQPGGGADLGPGSYLIDSVVSVPVTFTVPAGWYKGMHEFAVFENDSNSSIGFGSPDNIQADPCDPTLGMQDPAVGPTAADLATAIQELPGLIVSEPLEATLAGYPGLLLDVTADPVQVCDGELSLWGVGEDLRPVPDRMWILDVDGARLVILMHADPEAPADLTAEIQAVVDSVQIGPTEA